MNNIIEKEVKKIVDKIDFEQLRDKSILITGASGLVGIFLIASLKQIQKIYNIKIYASIKNDIDPKFSEIFKDCIVFEEDLSEINEYVYNLYPINVGSISATSPKFDYIIHAAGYAQPNKFLDDQIKTIKLNTKTTIGLLNRLKSNGKFLFISSSELYSGLDCENITENQIGITNTNHPRACYIEGKRCGETICYSYLNKGYDVRIARLSLAYGPGTKKGDNRVLNSLIQKGLDNDEIKLMDSGDAIRTYCYITDVVEMLWNVLLFGKETLYNVGGNSKTTILELAQLIGKNLNKQVSTPEVSKELMGSPKLVNISSERYLSEFKKNDFVSLQDGILKTIEWQKQL